MFLYKEALKKDIDFDFNVMKKPPTIPVVLSAEEVQWLLNSFMNLKHKATCTLCCSKVLDLLRRYVSEYKPEVYPPVLRKTSLLP